MPKPDGENSVKRRVAGVLLAWLFFAMDGVIGFILVQRKGGRAGRPTQETGMAEGNSGSGVAKSTAPGRKLTTGTAVIGLIGGFSWLIIISWLLPDHPNIALWGGVASGVGIWVGLLLRAKYTGKFDQ